MKKHYQMPGIKLLCLFSFLLLSSFLSAQTTRYVKPGGTGNGSSWAQASGDIQAMINTAAWGDPIWVAAGTYTRGAGQYYALKNGIKLYGGFPATGDPVFADRNSITYPTILQGNQGRLMFNIDTDNTALMDGFTLQGGTVPDNGGGIATVMPHL